MFQTIGKVMGALIGMSLSPTMPLLKLVTRDFFNFNLVLASPQAMPTEMARFMALAQAQPDAVLYGLCPKMIGCLVIGYAVLAFCTYAGGVVGQWTAQQFAPKPALE